MNAEIVTARAVATAIVRKTLESSIGEAGDSNRDFGGLSSLDKPKL
jgi:hypothetical protein